MKMAKILKLVNKKANQAPKHTKPDAPTTPVEVLISCIFQRKPIPIEVAHLTVKLLANLGDYALRYNMEEFYEELEQFGILEKE
jgi:hypothetical protein